MRIGIFSDTHGKELDKVRAKLLSLNLDEILFLGDVFADGEYFKKSIDLPFVQVLGNNDPSLVGVIDDERLLERKGYKILLVHGHKFGVYWSRKNLISYGRGKGADFIFYGHTHIFKDEEERGIRVICPGSASRPRDFVKSLVVMEIKDEVTIERVRL